MSHTTPSRRSKLFAFVTGHPTSSHQALTSPHGLSPAQHTPRASFDGRSPSPNYTDPFTSSHGHERLRPRQDEGMNDDLLPPHRPFSTFDGTNGGSSGLSSRRSSFSDKDGLKERPPSLSLNYLPSKFTKKQPVGEHFHKRAKQGGGRDAFAKNAQRMGMMGTVDDDEGVVFQLGKGGLKKKKPKLRWNRFKWILFACNTLLILYGIAFLIASILVWLNVFYQSDVIRVGNRTELILSTVAASVITLTSLIGYSGIILNNRTFLAIYTLLLWVCLGLLVAPGYMTYKQKTFNLEGKINLQWSRRLGTEGRLRIQNALRCCGYFSPYVEATQSPLCFARSNLAGCKNQYLKLERSVLTKWFAISFALVPAHIGIMIAALLCSNHITYRFGKGLTPKRYRLDLGSMAVIMDEYASQIAAQYGPQIAYEAFNNSSTNLDPAHRQSLSVPSSRNGSTSNLAVMSTGASGGLGLTRPTSRFAPSTHSTGYNSQSGGGLYDPSRSSFDDGSRVASPLTGGYAGQLAGAPGPGGSRSASRYIDTDTDAGDSNRYTDEDNWDRGHYQQPGQTQSHANQSDQTGWAR